MGYLVERDSEGRLIYVCDSFLTSREKAVYDNLLLDLENDIPKIEEGLKKEYGKSVLYKYFLGKCLSDFLEKYKINDSERRKFWDEIKDFATQEVRKRDDGSVSKRRSFYEQCYVLSQYNIEVVQKLSWRQWQDLLDRVSNREDERIFEWLRNISEKIREDDWREFEKALHLYLKSKDTSVFSDDELFEIYNTLFAMSIYWRIAFARFSKDFPNSAKIKSKTRRSKKYQSACFQIKKEKRKPLDDVIFAEAFDIAMK
ncbi:ATP-dependent helicase [Clostridium kluyveri]|uniref:ATP-dependent helicase n=1 Tax=Clostridium kluyveri TaxID=1534 RepID=A0A1L5FAA9_CLOKL|nr:ATP-dependent helicase [Clostridium kluyveri]APM39903.1 ATP-dependent helicase [Clostridium kluyveri]